MKTIADQRAEAQRLAARAGPSAATHPNDEGNDVNANANLPAKYLEARRALAAAHSFDEVKSIIDKNIALAVYAKLAKDTELIAQATEMRKRAERRVGELIEEKRKAGLLAKGAREPGTKRGATRVPERPASTLADQGVDKHLADRSRKAAAMPEQKFEASVARSVRMAVAATEGDRAVIFEARSALHEQKKAKRDERLQTLAATLLALPKKLFGILLIDAPWQYQNPPLGDRWRSVENHYPTMSFDELCALDVASIAADKCVLLMWATNPMLAKAFKLAARWGFSDDDYVTNAAWGKNKAGTGYWFRGKHELLLIFTHGDIPAPTPGTQLDSLVMAPVGRHSEKPDVFQEWIEKVFPNLPKIELFARRRRPGWDTFGTLEHEPVHRTMVAETGVLKRPTVPQPPAKARRARPSTGSAATAVAQAPRRRS